MRATTKVYTEGKITIPIHVREGLDIAEGDLVEIDVSPVEEGSES